MASPSPPGQAAFSRSQFDIRIGIQWKHALGRVSFTGNPDAPVSPNSNVSGGFAGILSTAAFNRVALTFLFDPTGISPTAVHTIRYAPIPEPSTFVSAFVVSALILWRLLSRRRVNS